MAIRAGKQMDMVATLGAVFAVMAALLLFGPDLKTLAGLISGSREYAGAAGKFEYDTLTRVLVAIALVVAVGAVFFLKLQLGALGSSFEQEQSVAVEAKRVQDAADHAFEQKRLTEIRERQEAEAIAKRKQDDDDRAAKVIARVDDLTRVIGKLTTIKLDSERVARWATRVENIDDAEWQVTEVHVDKGVLFDETVVVVHLFKDRAFWQLGSPHRFEDKQGAEMDFLTLLRTDYAKRLFRKHQVVAGLGLDSRTQRTDKDIPYQRAATLCTGLFNSIGSDKGTIPAGLSIGTYSGPLAIVGSENERRQRSIVIVGISVKDQSVDAGPVLEKVLTTVAVPGVDLAMYSDLSSGKPRWVVTQGCPSLPNFLRP